MPHALQMDVLAIVGMHRSGTSLCARICQRLGIYLGEDLLPGGPDNTDGYFEDRHVVRIHRRLLAALGPAWRSERSVQPMPDRWWLRPAVLAELAHLRNWLDRMRKQAGPGVFGFKDPRTARLLSGWNYLFGEMALRPAYLLCLRNPASVIQSLSLRNGIPRRQSELMWLQHTTAAILHSGDGPLMIVRYERWFDNPEAQIAQLANYLGLPKPEPGMFSEIIDPGKNHAQPDDFSPGFPITQKLYEELLNTPGERRPSASAREMAREFMAGEDTALPRLRFDVH